MPPRWTLGFYWEGATEYTDKDDSWGGVDSTLDHQGSITVDGEKALRGITMVVVVMYVSM